MIVNVTSRKIWMIVNVTSRKIWMIVNVTSRKIWMTVNVTGRNDVTVNDFGLHFFKHEICYSEVWI